MLLRIKKRNKGNYAFIDSQNLNLGIQKVGWKMDWRKFRIFLAEKYNVSKAYMFIGYMQENEALYEQLHESGYLIVLKPTVTDYSGEDKIDDDRNEDQKRMVKGNIDADLVLYAVKEINNYDKAIIVSGDGDFYSLIEYLLKNNKLRSLMTPNWQYSSLLKDFEKHILRLDTLRNELSYRNKKYKSGFDKKSKR